MRLHCTRQVLQLTLSVEVAELLCIPVTLWMRWKLLEKGLILSSFVSFSKCGLHFPITWSHGNSEHKSHSGPDRIRKFAC